MSLTRAFLYWSIVLTPSLVGCKALFPEGGVKTVTPSEGAAQADIPVVVTPSNIKAADPGIKTSDLPPTESELKSFFAPMNNARWDMPCEVDPGSATDCVSKTPYNRVIKVGGDSFTLYTVELRFRGVVEPMIYKGGAKEGDFYLSGTPAHEAFNIYRLSVSSPKIDYYLNAVDAVSVKIYTIDYVVKIDVYGGSTLTLFGDGQNGSILSNSQKLKVPGITTPASLETGQWIQMNVISVILKK